MRRDQNQSCAIAIAGTESIVHRAGLALRPMVERDIGDAVCLISRAMNAREGNQAQETLRFHFSCRRHGIDDGRRYYILTQGSAINGIAGLHHYVWGPPENVWLAWFAVEPGLVNAGREV